MIVIRSLDWGHTRIGLRELLLVGALAFSAYGIAPGQAVGNAEHSGQPSAATATTTPGPGTPEAKASTDDSYVIGNDDVLGINVWKEQELTESVPVRSDGKISLPLIGEVEAAGLTPLQLKDTITTKLRAFLEAPSVTVTVLQMNSQKFNILGRVLKPGMYPLKADTTVLDAIAQAGGFQDFAKQKAIYILRHSTNGGEIRIPFNYKDVIRGEHPNENIKLRPNDTIVVP